MAFPSEEDSADTDFRFLLLPAFIQGVFVTTVVMRLVSSGTGKLPCKSCTIQISDPLLHVCQHAFRACKSLLKVHHDILAIALVLVVLELH